MDSLASNQQYNLMENETMAKYKSRRTRCSEAISSLEALRNDLEEIKSTIESEKQSLEALKAIISHIEKSFDSLDFSELESLREEVENWKNGMEGTNLENTEKYQTLESTFDGLDNIVSTLERLDSPTFTTDQGVEALKEEILEYLEQTISEIDEAASEADGLEFPGMY